MSIRSIQAFKGDPFNSIQAKTPNNAQIGVQTPAPAPVQTQTQTPAPAPVSTPTPAPAQTQAQTNPIQQSAPASSAQTVTPAQAQAAQVMAKPDKKDITKILSLGAAALGAAAVGYSIYKGKKVTSQIENLSQNIDNKIVSQFENLKETITNSIDTSKIIEEVKSGLKITAPKGGSDKALKVLEVVLLALGGKETIDVLKGASKGGEGKDKKSEAVDTKKLGESLSNGLQTIINEKVNVAQKNASKPDESQISKNQIQQIRGEAAARMAGKYFTNWNISKPEAWMVTAETVSFNATGGLGEVAVQLPEIFNKTSENGAKGKMTIVTPMYVDGNCKLTDNKDGTYTYLGGKNNSIIVKEIGKEKVKSYEPITKSYQDEEFTIYKGTYNGTDYIFIRNDEYFSIKPQEGKSSLYALNTKGVGETERFAMFSKAAVELMKNVKEGKIKDGVEAPNIIIGNDWHAGSMLPIMRYSIPVLKEQKKIDEETAKYFDSVPFVTITHNTLLQGATYDYEVSDKIVHALFEENTDKISPSIDKTGAGCQYPMSSQFGSYNPFLAAANLSDRVVAVSRNYAQELSKSDDLSGSAKNAFAERKKPDKETFFGIINGYNKTSAEPNDKMINKINEKFELKGDKQFKVYAGKYDDEGYQIKMENKKALGSLLNRLATKDQVEKYKSSFVLHDAEHCEMPSEEELMNTPVVCNVGRMAQQKGLEHIKVAIKKLAHADGGVKPVFIILGSSTTDEENIKYLKPLKDLKDELTKENPEFAKRIFIFDGYDANLRDAIYCGSDFGTIPSNWEPCGLTQMENMAKGTIPVALATGGLVDTIENGKTGYLSSRFFGYSSGQLIYENQKSGSIVDAGNNSDAFTEVLYKALNTYSKDKQKIKEMSINCMQKDFSWDKSGSLQEYIDVMKTGKIGNEEKKVKEPKEKEPAEEPKEKEPAEEPKEKPKKKTK